MSATRASLQLRTLHRIAALFLTPWVLMYGLSTLVMNHRASWLDSAHAPALERLRSLHKNGAFEDDALRDLAWTLSVDLFAFAMLFWIASGTWLWWKMPATRTRGAVAGLIGLAAFALFVSSI